jgi:hypothetical protein
MELRLEATLKTSAVLDMTVAKDQFVRLDIMIW